MSEEPCKGTLDVTKLHDQHDAKKEGQRELNKRIDMQEGALLLPVSGLPRIGFLDHHDSQ